MMTIRKPLRIGDTFRACTGEYCIVTEINPVYPVAKIPYLWCKITGSAVDYHIKGLTVVDVKSIECFYLACCS